MIGWLWFFGFCGVCLGCGMDGRFIDCFVVVDVFVFVFGVFVYVVVEYVFLGWYVVFW